VLFGFLLHLIDLLVGEADTALDGDRLGVARALILGLHVDDTVLVDVEGDLDLGVPAGAGGMPESWNAPSSSFSSAISRSPWKTRTLTEVWLSAAVVNTFDSSVGIVVFFSMSRSKRPPFTSIPSESGVTSSRTMSSTSPESTPP